MKRGLSALASVAILGGSLFLGAGAANAVTCPAGQHAITMGGVSSCVPDASGGGTGGNTTIDLGGSAPAAPAPIQMPAQPAPAPYQPPAYTPPVYAPPVATAPQAPAYTPQVPAPAAPYVPYVPSAPQAPAVGSYAGTFRAPAAGQAPVFTAPSGVAVARNAAGAWVDQATGEAVDPQVAAQAEEAAAAAPAEVAKAPEAIAQEAAVALQAAKEASVQKAADLALTRRQVEAAVTKALDDALARR